MNNQTRSANNNSTNYQADSNVVVTRHKKVRCGVTPDTSAVNYTISTEQIRTYLQESIDALCSVKGIQSVEIDNVSTAKIGAKMYPIILTLPMEMLQGGTRRQNNNKKRNDDILDIIERRGGYTTKQKMESFFYDIFKPFKYDKGDVDHMTRPENRKDNGLSDIKAVEDFRRYYNPAVCGKGNNKRIIMFLDPRRLLPDMMVEEGQMKHPAIDINKCSKFREGEYRYHITRYNYTGNNKNKNRKGSFNVNNFLKGAK